MADKSFEQGCQELSKLVGDGDLAGTFVVNGGMRTVPLETGAFENHMGYRGRVDIQNYHGGGPAFVGGAIAENHIGYLNEIADSVLEGDVCHAMVDCMEDMTEELQRRAPIREGYLRQSGAEFVTDGGSPIHESFGASYGQEPR